MRLNLEFLFVKKIGDIWPKIGQKSAIFEEMYKNRQIRDFWGSLGDIVKNISGNTGVLCDKDWNIDESS